MLSEARRRNPDIDFLNSTAEELPFPDGKFNAVVGNYILHHSGEPEKVLSESLRVLKPGGKAAFTVWASPEKLEAFGLFFGAVGEHVEAPELPHGPLFGVSDFNAFHQLLCDAGFRDTSVEELSTAWRTSSIESYISAFRDWANLHTLPDDLRKRIEDKTLKLAERYQSEGIYSIPNPTILISGAKGN